MTARHFYRFDPDEEPDEVTTVLRWGYSSTEKAEEGEAGMLEIVVDDPDMTLDFVGHRSWTIYEDDAEGDQLVFFGGFTQAVRIAHKGGDITQPIARVWVIEVADMNTLWNYRILTNDECERPAETDVERMQWLLTTAPEFSFFDDPASYVSTANPVDMDEADVRGQTPAAVADSCAQQSGKNWWLQAIDDAMPPGDGRTTFVWYGFDSIPVYDSPLSLSNDPADLDMPAVNDGSATTYPLGADTELRRDYARQYSGAYGEYQKGSRYVRNAATAALLTPTRQRDIASPAPEIATKAKMDAQLRRVLRDHATPDHVIKTTIELTGNKLPHLRAGMRVPFKATHLPDYEEGRVLRALSATATPTGRRAGFDTYNLALELQGPGTSAPAPSSCSTALGAIDADIEVGTNVPYLSYYVGDPTNTFTPDADGRVISFMFGSNPNSPHSTNMTTPTGYALIQSALDVGRFTFAVSSKAGTSGVATTANATYTPGFNNFGNWQAIQFLIRTSATSPVQTKYATTTVSATFDATPTIGNMLVMIVAQSDLAGPGPYTVPTGWTEVWQEDEIAANGHITACFAKCVETGDGSTFGVGALGGLVASRAIVLMEWEITA